MLLVGFALFRSYTRIKNIGFAGEAFATTWTGELTVVLFSGLATSNEKSFEPVNTGGSVVFAGGAGSGLVEGDHVMGTAGVEGKLGCGGALIELEPDPHPASPAIPKRSRKEVGTTINFLFLESLPAVSLLTEILLSKKLCLESLRRNRDLAGAIEQTGTADIPDLRSWDQS